MLGLVIGLARGFKVRHRVCIGFRVMDLGFRDRVYITNLTLILNSRSIYIHVQKNVDILQRVKI